MAKKSRKLSATKSARLTTSARVSRTIKVEPKTSSNNDSLFDKIQHDLQNNQSYLNLLLGGLIIVVLAVLVYNYFNRPEGNIGPAQETQTQETDSSADVDKNNLPGKYKVKAGDTLFTIAQKYYDDGYKYTKIMEENQLENENLLAEGQEITIPKLEDQQAIKTDEQNLAESSPSPEASVNPDGTMLTQEGQTDTGLALTENKEQTAQPNQSQPSNQNAGVGTGGAENQTIWGEKISADTYTVQAGDWLSKIAGRAYGDIFQYEKIAKANNITNPDNIEVGTVLKLPR